MCNLFCLSTYFGSSLPTPKYNNALLTPQKPLSRSHVLSSMKIPPLKLLRCFTQNLRESQGRSYPS